MSGAPGEPGCGAVEAEGAYEAGHGGIEEPRGEGASLLTPPLWVGCHFQGKPFWLLYLGEALNI